MICKMKKKIWAIVKKLNLVAKSFWTQVQNWQSLDLINCFECYDQQYQLAIIVLKMIYKIRKMKLSYLKKMTENNQFKPFWACLAQIWATTSFFQKSGFVNILGLLNANLMKNYWLEVWELLLQTDWRTEWQTDGAGFIRTQSKS